MYYEKGKNHHIIYDRLRKIENPTFIIRRNLFLSEQLKTFFYFYRNKAEINVITSAEGEINIKQYFPHTINPH